MLKLFSHTNRKSRKSPPDKKVRLIDHYIDSYHTFLGTEKEISLDCLEPVHRAISSSLHRDADCEDIIISAFLYSALRLPECMDSVSRVILVPNERALKGWGHEDIHSWRPALSKSRRRRALFDGKKTLAIFISSVSDIDDLLPALCAYQIEWNKMHERLTCSALGPYLKSGRASASNVQGALRKALRITSADHDMFAEVWSDCWDRKMAAVATAPKNFRIRMFPSEQSEYERDVQEWWCDLLEYFSELEIETRPLYVVSSNTHSLANIISGFAYRFRNELVIHALENDHEGLRRQWQSLKGEEYNAKLNFLYYAQRAFVESDMNLGKIRKDMEESAGLRRFVHGSFSDQETQVIDLSRIRPDCMDGRLEKDKLNILKKSRALVINIDYPLGFSAYHMLSRIIGDVRTLRGVYIMGKSAAMIGRIGDIMIPSEIRDEHTHNRYSFRNCFSIRNLVGYLRNSAVFDDQRSVTVRGTFLHSWDSIKDLHKEDFTGIEMEAGPYISALYEYIQGHRAPRDSFVSVDSTEGIDIGVLHYSSDTPYNVRASLLSKRLGYMGLEATYTCTLAILQSIFNRETAILKGKFR